VVKGEIERGREGERGRDEIPRAPLPGGAGGGLKSIIKIQIK